MSRAQRDKGARRERELVRLMRAEGLRAVRVPMSGALAKHLQTGSHDVDIWPHGRIAPLVTEVKARKTLPKQITKWLGGNDVLALKGDGLPWIFVLPERVMLELLAGTEARQANSNEKGRIYEPI